MVTSLYACDLSQNLIMAEFSKTQIYINGTQAQWWPIPVAFNGKVQEHLHMYCIYCFSAVMKILFS